MFSTRNSQDIHGNRYEPLVAVKQLWDWCVVKKCSLLRPGNVTIEQVAQLGETRNSYRILVLECEPFERPRWQEDNICVKYILGTLMLLAEDRGHLWGFF